MASPFCVSMNLIRLHMSGSIQWDMQPCNTLRFKRKHALIRCDAQALIDSLQRQVEQDVARLTTGSSAQGLICRVQATRSPCLCSVKFSL